MNFFSDLQHDYEDKASKWLVNFQGPNFDIPEELKENVGLIGAMCEVSRLQSIDPSDHLTFQCIYFCFLNIFYQQEVATKRNEVENLSKEIAEQEQELQNIRQTQISMNLEFQEFEKLCFELQQKEKDIGLKINILEKKHREKNVRIPYRRTIIEHLFL